MFFRQFLNPSKPINDIKTDPNTNESNRFYFDLLIEELKNANELTRMNSEHQNTILNFIIVFWGGVITIVSIGEKIQAVFTNFILENVWLLLFFGIIFSFFGFIFMIKDYRIAALSSYIHNEIKPKLEKIINNSPLEMGSVEIKAEETNILSFSSYQRKIIKRNLFWYTYIGLIYFFIFSPMVMCFFVYFVIRLPYRINIMVLEYVFIFCVIVILISIIQGYLILRKSFDESE